VIACAWFERRTLAADWAFAGRSLLLFVATVLIVWPGAILKLSFVKGYLFMAYLAVFRKSPWGSEGFLETWQKRFLSSPVEWLVILAALLVWIFSSRLKGKFAVLYPFVIYAVLMLGVTLRVTTGSPRYALPFEPTLDVLAGCVAGVYLAMMRRISAYAAPAIVCIGLFGTAWWNLRQNLPGSDSRLSALLAYVRENHLDASRLLVPQDDVPPLHYYFPSTRLRGYTGPAPDASPSFADGTEDGILYPGFPIRYRAVTSR
jgi:hypothetical protein